MKIYFVTSGLKLLPYQQQALDALGDFKSIDGQKMTAEEVIKLIPDVDILLAGSSGIARISSELLDGLPSLKFISLFTVGTDWVDLEACRQKGIKVSNIKGASAQSVAEHAWGMILNLSKRISEVDRDIRDKGIYEFRNYQGKEVFGKTLGVIGVGEIGSRVAKIGQAFNMTVLGVNKSSQPIEGVKLVSLEELLKTADVIAVCVNLNEETKDLISAKEIAMMKDGAILVNTSREAIVNQSAVVEAVHSGKLFGYGIETEIMQPIPKDSPYLTHPRILVTPHTAFHTLDAEIQSTDLVIANVKSFLDNQPKNLV